MKKIANPSAKITNDHGEKHTYVFEPIAIDAINAALCINRPLLIYGEPGVGKSQLAKAAAKALERTYIPFVVNAATEATDLQWSFDAIARLADAQIEGAINKNVDDARQKLALKNYIKPGPLWAALNWKLAKSCYPNEQDTPLDNYFNADKALENGVVVLIDEIDKADSSVPNGLLEVLGANRFHPDGFDKAIEVERKGDKKGDEKGIAPLIIITTNKERLLPDAFIRRCLSITLGLPAHRHEQVKYLVNHAKPNFSELDIPFDEEASTVETILETVANMVLDDREQAEKDNQHPLPGQAEYFDLLRGLQAMKEDASGDELLELIQSLSRFTSKKQHGK